MYIVTTFSFQESSIGTEVIVKILMQKKYYFVKELRV